jgi:prepilin-type N-terminal cleavage/methylation domain-containing protein/prepilin-type processing-associated H-X9-DG protein
MERNRSSSGFTLVELLVVIAIIAILAGLLLPGISRTGNRAKETICLNNLRQIGVGIKMYQNDNNGRFPIRIGRKGALSTPPASRKENRADWRFFDMAIGGGEPAATTPPQLPRAAEKPLFNYMKNFETFHCPFDGGWDFRPEGEHVAPTAYAAHGCSYQYNAHRSDRDQPLGLEGLAGKPESWVPDPSTFILMYEPPAYVEPSYTNNLGWVVFWHRARKAATMRLEDYNINKREKRISPILFVDGHAAILNFTDLGAANLNTTEWMWWKPVP